MRSIVLAMSFLCVLFSSPAEARRHHGGRLPWCGIYMGKYFGMSDRSLWVARNWARVGAPAGGPAPGVVVVWPHHVGVIVGAAPDGKWIVHSGNDGGAVRTRPRSLSRVIAYRHIGGTSSAYADLKGQEQTVARGHKHLVALAVEGGETTRLKQPRAHTRLAMRAVEPSNVWNTAAFAVPAQLAHEVGPKKRKPVMKRERMLVPLFTPMSDPVMPHVGEVRGFGSSAHSSPRTRLVQEEADRPSSRASLRSVSHTPRASRSSGSGGREHAADAGADWRAFQQAHF